MPAWQDEMNGQTPVLELSTSTEVNTDVSMAYCEYKKEFAKKDFQSYKATKAQELADVSAVIASVDGNVFDAFLLFWILLKVDVLQSVVEE